MRYEQVTRMLLVKCINFVIREDFFCTFLLNSSLSLMMGGLYKM